MTKNVPWKHQSLKNPEHYEKIISGSGKPVEKPGELPAQSDGEYETDQNGDCFSRGSGRKDSEGR